MNRLHWINLNFEGLMERDNCQNEPGMKSLRKAQLAFTLIELLVVIAIIAILAFARSFSREIQGSSHRLPQ